MNLLTKVSENDQEYKAYFSVLKSALKSIDGNASQKVFYEYMRGIQEKFPYAYKTNARVMVVAYHMAITGREFDPSTASDLLGMVFSGKENKEILIIDVARYFKRLRT